MSTGEAARELGVREPYLQHLIRQGKIVPPPKVRGRRKWSPRHVEAAREVLARY